MTPSRAALLWKVALPVACLGAGVAGGYLAGARSVPRAVPPVMLREGGFRYVNPLLLCGASELEQSAELMPFREEVVAHLQAMRYPGVDNVSVYFRELNDGLWFSIGETRRFAPASLRKVPMMIALLKQAERAPQLLVAKVRVDLQEDHDAQQAIKPSVRLERGHEYTVAELIRRMIVYSDNDAFMVLSTVVDPAELDRVYAQLDPRGAAIGPRDFLSAYTFASFFRILYNASYLGKDLSEWALATLAHSEFRDGIVAGVPPDVPVAHKFGEAREDVAGTSVQLHDCGVVYAPGHPYLLCIMTRGPSLAYLDDAIASTSRVIFSAVLAQARASR